MAEPERPEPDAAAFHRLGDLLTGTEARLVAHALEEGLSVSSAFARVGPDRRADVMRVLSGASLRAHRGLLIAALHAIDGARSHTSRVAALWTMPGARTGSGGLTSSIVDLVGRARESVVCSTFNFQRTSGMWAMLREVAARSGMSTRVYLDSAAATSGSTPTLTEVADRLAPAVVLATGPLDGRLVRNHAKFVSIDHRWVVVTSANFSWSAEYSNVELGVVVDDPALVDRIEREMRDAEDALYYLVRSSHHRSDVYRSS